MKTIKRFGRLLFAAVALSALTVAPSAFAASNTDGAIATKVVSSSGSPVSGATVTVNNTDTGFSRTLSSDADGSVRFPALSVGDYTVSVTASGYQDAQRKAHVAVGVSTDLRITMYQAGEETATLSTVTVKGGQISPIDITSTESSTNLGEAQIDRIPVARTVSGVALLAPGTTQGDYRFGNLVSFGGSTVGENVCYINGLDVTNFRNGLGCSTVPFEFYKEFQLKTGGFSAEFGRSTGGVINAATKSGSNEFHWGANLYMEPWVKNLSGHDPNVYQPIATQDVYDSSGDYQYSYALPGGQLIQDNKFDQNSSLDFNVYVSGPIIKDKLFYYMLFNPRQRDAKDYDAVNGNYYKISTSNPFYGAKFDYYITDNHKLALTAFSDSRTVKTKAYDYTGGGEFQKGQVGGYNGAESDKSGGDNAILTYTGYFGPDFTLSASYGINKYDQSTYIDPDTALVFDYRTSPRTNIGNPLGGGPYGTNKDERDMWRVDAQWYIGDHTLKFGADYQTRKSFTDIKYTGQDVYTSPTPGLVDGPTFNGGNIYYFFPGSTPTTGTVWVRHYSTQGNYKTETNALYVEDKWQVTDNFLVSLGLRDESFNNMNRAGDSFIKMTNQIAPRLGFSWDAMGDGSLKIYGNYGRYYLPIANNTNVRFAGGETYFIDQWTWDGTFDQNNVPGIGTYQGNVAVYGDGSVPDTYSLIDRNLDPMYQDEYILGFQKDIGNGWSWGVRGTYRDLKSTIEDAVLLPTDPSLAPAYALINPGNPVTLCNTPGDPSSCTTYPADQTGYPDSTRKYASVEFLFEKAWDGEFFLQGSYTWAHSWGNNEGYVKSDNGQTDAGITSSFDYPGLTDYTYGNLPNDRRNAFKLYGAWQFDPSWQVGANVLMESGRPYSALGVHPTDANAAAYGAESFYQGGVPAPRGSRGRTPFVTSVDLSLKYFTTLGGGDLTLGLDLFNVFDAHNARTYREQAENRVSDSTSATGYAASPRSDYMTETSWQSPRSIRLSAQIDF